MSQPIRPRICRVCLTGDIQLQRVAPASLSLHAFYELLTDVKLNNGGPETLCSYCVAMLQKCCKFTKMARRANTVLEQWRNGNTDWVPMTLLHSLTRTAVDIHTYIHVTDLSDKRDVKSEALSFCVDNVDDNISTYLENMETDRKSEDIFKESPNFDKAEQLNDLKMELEDINSHIEANSRIEDSNSPIGDYNSQNGDTNIQILVCNSPKSRAEGDINNKIVKTKIHNDFSKNKSKTHQKDNNNVKINLLSNKKELKTYRKLSKPEKETIITVEKEKPLSCDLCNYQSFSLRYINQHKTRVHSSGTSVACPVCKEKIDNITNLNKHIKKFHKQLNIKVKLLSCSSCNFTCLKKSQLNKHLLRHNDEIKCVFCEYIGTKVEMRRHMKRHIAGRQFDCDLCGFKGDTKLSVVQHRIDIHRSSEKLFQCLMCDFKCISRHQLKSHIWKHEGEKSCTECATEFQDRYDLNEHLKQHNEKISCDNCDYKCSNKIQLLNHIKVHLKKISCDHCNKQFLRINHLKSHLKRHRDAKSHICNLCDYKTDFANNLKRHLLTHSTSKPYNCPECKTKHKSETNLKNHMKTVHNKIYRHKTHSCNKCSFKCEKKNQLRTHLKIKHASKPFRKKPGQKCICNDCGFAAAKKSELERHIFIHTGYKPYICPECKLAFKCKYYLKKHIKMKHVFDRKTCTRCNKLFQNETELQIHTNVCLKKFLCDICGSKWKNSLLLKRHMMIHTGEKPFACDICLYKCSLESSLVKHMRVHTNEKPYACDKCSYRCRVNSNLLRHLASHSSEKPFSCHICDARYKIKRDLKRHINRLHGCSDVN